MRTLSCSKTPAAKRRTHRSTISWSCTVRLVSALIGRPFVWRCTNACCCVCVLRSAVGHWWREKTQRASGSHRRGEDGCCAHTTVSVLMGKYQQDKSITLSCGREQKVKRLHLGGEPCKGRNFFKLVFSRSQPGQSTHSRHWISHIVQPGEVYTRHIPNCVHSIPFKHKQNTKRGALLMKHPVHTYIHTYIHTYRVFHK